MDAVGIGWGSGAEVVALAGAVEDGAERLRGQAALLRGLAGLPWRGAAAGAFAVRVGGVEDDAGATVLLLDGWAAALRACARHAAARAELLERAAALGVLR